VELLNMFAKTGVTLNVVTIIFVRRRINIKPVIIL